MFALAFYPSPLPINLSAVNNFASDAIEAPLLGPFLNSLLIQMLDLVRRKVEGQLSYFCQGANKLMQSQLSTLVLRSLVVIEYRFGFLLQ